MQGFAKSDYIALSGIATVRFILTNGKQWVFGLLDDRPNEHGKRVYHTTQPVQYDSNASADEKRKQCTLIFTYMIDFVSTYQRLAITFLANAYPY